MENIIASLDKIVLDPKYHDLLCIVKGVRNGVVYGSKIRFSHALVMTFLFRNGTIKSKLKLVLNATKEHARNLGTFVFIYKATLYILKKTHEKEQPTDTLIAGLLGGYFVFGRGGKSSVNQQIVLYVFSRVVLGLSKLAVEKRVIPSISDEIGNTVYPIFASVCWGLVMYLFRTDPQVLQVSMKNSMDYIYLDSNYWTNLRTLLWHNK
ncbi:Tim17/Tim22/Tim23/Pmp24 family-domain-containing protein [Lipomyces japonicus]|uniref:Tim17/Tim22/Tim23/Pmp24 family-domain-containing protein n=1 Tax=Lipomyces japonicus TaxID=56871 RepID=UPI0034CE7CFE